jgi:hypothetical protein
MDYDELYALRVYYQDEYDDEYNIIKSLKIYLFNNRFRLNILVSDINNILINFYQTFNINLTDNDLNNIFINENIDNIVINEELNDEELNNNELNDEELEEELNNEELEEELNNEELEEELNNEELNNEELEEELNDEELNNYYNYNQYLIINNNNNNNNNFLNLFNINNVNNTRLTENNLSTYIYYNIFNNIDISNNIIRNRNRNMNITFGYGILFEPLDQNYNIFNGIFDANNLVDINCTLDKDEMQKLKKLKLEDNLDIKCSICLGELIKDEEIIYLNCNHKFHSGCIEEWLEKYNYKCPECRDEVGKPHYNI